MDIKTLESFRLSDAITFHDELNPKLWAGRHLRPEVKKQLKVIADDFMDELGISGLDVVDVTVSGSNAAYSYTPHSDLDLHILVDMTDMPNDEVYKELFNAKKNIYNDSHDITIHGVPVELYVQDSRDPVVSLGEYSLKDNDWIKLPTKRRANLDQTATKQKYEKLLDIINTALKSKNLGKINKVLKKIRQYRQAGLDKGGEFGPENLAFKVLRSQGYITKLYQLRDKLHSEVLTIENMYQDPQFGAEKTPAVNPYGGLKDRQYRGAISENSMPKFVYHVTPTKNLKAIAKQGLVPNVGDRSSQIAGEKSGIYVFPDKVSAEDAVMNWLGDEFEDEPLTMLKIDVSGLEKNITKGADYELIVGTTIEPSRIKKLNIQL